MLVEFQKYEGAGNDFVIVDNTNLKFSHLNETQIQLLCNRTKGIGADGFISIENHHDYDFKMNYYNADGKIGSLCGNGSRCAVDYYVRNTPTNKTHFKFMASDGVHNAIQLERGMVDLQMQDIENKEIQNLGPIFILDTGSPHYVEFVNSVSSINVFDYGRQVRYNEEFKNIGINVNLAEVVKDNVLEIRTYERGVEDETQACGTGATATALGYIMKNGKKGNNSIVLHTLGGDLRVNAYYSGDEFKEIYLIGPARFIYEGKIEI